MRRKYKLTGCARFLIFLVIAVPVIFFTAQFITGENPLTELKSALGWGKDEVEVVEPYAPQSDTLGQIETSEPESTDDRSIKESAAPEQKTLSQFDSKISDLNKRISELEKRLEQLESRVRDTE